MAHCSCWYACSRAATLQLVVFCRFLSTHTITFWRILVFAGLFDMVMIKDNHIAAAGGIAAAVKATEVRQGRGLRQAVKCRPSLTVNPTLASASGRLPAGTVGQISPPGFHCCPLSRHPSLPA